LDDGDNRPLVRLTDLPALAKLSLTDATLDEASCANIAKFASLESFDLHRCRVTGPLEFRAQQSRLDSITIWHCSCDSLNLHDLPALDWLDLQNDDQLRVLTLARLPQLKQCRAEACHALGELSLVDLPRLPLFGLRYMPARGASSFRPPPAVWLRQAEGLPALTQLTLSGYRLHPGTAANIGRIASLTELYLGESWVSDFDVEQFRGLTELRSLFLNGSDVTLAGLKTILKLPKLKSLMLHGSLVRMDGDTFAGLGESPQIDMVWKMLESEQPDVPPASVAARNGNQLAFWDRWLASASMEDADLPEIGGLPNLAALNLWGAHVTDAGLKSLGKLSNLRALNLAETHVTDRGLSDLAKLNRLEALGLADTAVDGSGFERLAPLEHLTALDLSESEIRDDGLANLKYLPSLEVLSLAKTRITDAGLEYLAVLKKLRRLDLSDTKITAAGLAALRELPALRSLALQNCPLDQHAVAQLARAPALEELDLNGGEFGPFGLSDLKALPRLRSLNFRGLQPSSHVWVDLAWLAQLRELSFIAAGLDDDAMIALSNLSGLKTLKIAFAKGLRKLPMDSGILEQRASILQSLKLNLLGVNVIELPDWQDDARPFWEEAFVGNPLRRDDSHLMDAHDIGPVSPHPDSATERPAAQ
jgi:internalin A